MKKLLLVLISLFFSAAFLNAQDLTLSWNGKPVTDTIYAYGDANAAEIVCHAVVTNATSKAMNIKVKRERIFLVEGALSQFCWGLCYPPNTEDSPQYHLLEGNESSAPEQFSGHYLPNGFIGTSYVKYTFYNMDNPDQNVSVIAKYMATPSGIAEESMIGGSVSELYPNPANQVVSMDYRLTDKVDQAEVKVFNLLGAEVRSARLERNGSKLAIDISGLENGIYFYSVLVNNDVYQTKKLVIQR